MKLMMLVDPDPAGGSLGTVSLIWSGPSDCESSTASSTTAIRRMMRGQASAGFAARLCDLQCAWEREDSILHQ